MDSCSLWGRILSSFFLVLSALKYVSSWLALLVRPEFSWSFSIRSTQIKYFSFSGRDSSTLSLYLSSSTIFFEYVVSLKSFSFSSFNLLLSRHSFSFPVLFLRLAQGAFSLMVLQWLTSSLRWWAFSAVSEKHLFFSWRTWLRHFSSILRTVFSCLKAATILFYSAQVLKNSISETNIIIAPLQLLFDLLESQLSFIYDFCF